MSMINCGCDLITSGVQYIEVSFNNTGTPRECVAINRSPSNNKICFPVFMLEGEALPATGSYTLFYADSHTETYTASIGYSSYYDITYCVPTGFALPSTGSPIEASATIVGDNQTNDVNVALAAGRAYFDTPSEPTGEGSVTVTINYDGENLTFESEHYETSRTQFIDDDTTIDFTS